MVRWAGWRVTIGIDRLFTTTSESEITRKNAGITRIPAFLNLARRTDLDIGKIELSQCLFYYLEYFAECTFFLQVMITAITN